MEWTEEQKAVIDYRQGTLLVSAAAGSGKTAVLVQRLLDWVVKDGKNIDEFLVVTFTRAAAGQMRSKIRAALEALQEQHPDNQHIIRQLSLVHRADITTIDSFCRQVVNENFQRLGIDPSMRVMDETEGILMQEDVLTRTLERAYEEKSDEMLFLHQYMNDIRSDGHIRSLLRRLLRQAESYPYPEEWLADAKRDAMAVQPEELSRQPWMQTLVREVKTLYSEVRELPERILAGYRKLEPEYRPKAYNKYCAYFEEECRLAEAVERADTYRELQLAFDSSGRVYKRFIWKNTGVPESHYLSELWNVYADVRKEAAGRVSRDLDEIALQQEEVSGVLLTILEVTEDFLAEYRKEKQKKNCMDFGDVEHYALQALSERGEDGQPVPTEAARQLQDTYVEILIDEYQDSNDLQEAILTSIARRQGEEYSNLFMVGDMKQSIYKFRMARPRLFQEKYRKFSDDLSGKGISKKIELRRNFRSRETVLESVNLIFYQLMTDSLGGIDYTASTALTPGRVFEKTKRAEDYRTEILMLDSVSEDLEENTETSGQETVSGKEKDPSDGQEDSGYGEAPDAVEQEARLAAEQIRKLCDLQRPLLIWEEATGTYRPCRYRDIVILLRTVRGWSETFCRILSEEGIPAYAESGRGYFDSVEVKNLLCMLAVIDNSRDDIALAGALRSPLVSVTSEEMAALRCRYPQGQLWEILQVFAVERKQQESEQEKRLREKISVFLHNLQGWKEQKTYSTIRELIWSILKETGYYEYAGAMPNGKRRQGNILKLIEKASDYEHTSYRGLFDFLRYIERMKVTEQDFGEAAVLGANDDLVRIMTVHKSKGLEFPVVLLCGCGKQINRKDTEDTVLVDADCFLAVNDKHLEKHYYEKSVKRNCLARHMKEENQAEELRILYVAMTRAKEKLILIGTVDSRTAKKNEDYQLLRSRYLAAGEAVKAGADTDPERSEVEKEGGFLVDTGRETTGGEGKQSAGKRPLPSLGKRRISAGYSYLTWLIPCLIQMENRGIRQDCLDYRIVGPEEMLLQGAEEINSLQERQRLWERRLSLGYRQETLASVTERFQWEYPHPMAAREKGKLSVSEIKKMSQIVDEPEPGPPLESRTPGDAEASAGAAYGTLIHLVMEKLSFLQKDSVDQVEQGLCRLRDRGVLTEEERLLVSPEKIYHMIASGLGQRMQQAEQAGRLYRERQFVIGIPMNQIYGQGDEEDLELVQGIIDAYFEEEGEWVLVDYKTDTVSKVNGAEELVKRYRAQLDCYRKTLEQLTEKRVKETYIYSFCLEQAILLT